MKNLSKIILLILSVLILILFSSCGIKESKNESTTNNNISEDETLFIEDETSSITESKFDKTNYEPKISKSVAKEKSEKILKEYIESDLKEIFGANSTDEFNLISIEIKMPSENSNIYKQDKNGNVTEIKFKNPYWRIDYEYENSLSDIAYFLIDAENGETIYRGYMGD